ncbi:hypothetical protein J4220_02985 [Candidatus Micrarchaeota archaeon]|nr:hypothetical protein [Candidatus Micrarchaeota archaeon]
MFTKLKEEWRDYIPAAFFLLLAAAWFFGRTQITAAVCAPQTPCILHPEEWPGMLGITSSSSPLLVGLLIAVLFALPVGRSGLVATLVAINLGNPVFGFWGVFAIFTAASLASVVGVHWVVEKGLKRSISHGIEKRLGFFKKLLSPSIKKHPLVSLGLGNLAGSQWHMSALGVICGVKREKIWAGLMAGNIAGFALVSFLNGIPNLDAVSIVLIVVAATLAISAPALASNVRKK